MLMLCHIDALAAEADALHLQTCPLLQSRFVLQLDLTTGADHALPGQPAARLLQELRDVPVIERIACRRCDLAVGRDLSLGNRADRLAECLVARLALWRSPQFARDL